VSRAARLADPNARIVSLLWNLDRDHHGAV